MIQSQFNKINLLLSKRLQSIILDCINKKLH